MTILLYWTSPDRASHSHHSHQWRRCSRETSAQVSVIYISQETFVSLSPSLHHSHFLSPSLPSDHSDVCSILESRLQVLRDVRSQWSLSNPKVCMQYVQICSEMLSSILHFLPPSLSPPPPLLPSFYPLSLLYLLSTYPSPSLPSVPLPVVWYSHQ